MYIHIFCSHIWHSFIQYFDLLGSPIVLFRHLCALSTPRGSANVCVPICVHTRTHTHTNTRSPRQACSGNHSLWLFIGSHWNSFVNELTVCRKELQYPLRNVRDTQDQNYYQKISQTSIKFQIRMTNKNHVCPVDNLRS